MRHLKTVHRLLFLILLSLLLAAGVMQHVRAEIALTVNDTLRAYTAGQVLQGSLTIVSDEEFPNDTFLVAFIDETAVESQPIADLLSSSALSLYEPVAFSYNLTAAGTQDWTAFPPVTFDYVITASGTLPSGEPWEASTETKTATVSNQNRTINLPVDGYTGSRIINASSLITLPAGLTNVQWQVTASDNRVETTMRAACAPPKGETTYFPQNGERVRPDGWLRTKLDNLAGLPGTDCSMSVGPFDPSSLTTDRKKFISPDELDETGQCVDTIPLPGEPVCGGLYKPQGNTLVYQSASEFSIDGDTLIIHNCDQTLDYRLAYLPPNGEMFCAYTDESQRVEGVSWARTSQRSGSVTFDKPVTINHAADPALAPPACPAGCSSTVESYTLTDTSTADTITLRFDEENLTVIVSTASRQLRSSLPPVTIGFNEFRNLRAPSGIGSHTLRFDLTSANQVLASGSQLIQTCSDGDGDGFCGAADCNEGDSRVHVGAPELCNSIDDNCDGRSDDPYPLLNQSCNNSPGNICAGIYVCAADGLDVACNGAAPTDEICANRLDDDCDGLIDESGAILEGIVQECKGETMPTDFCTDGATRPGGNDQGVCTSVSTCRNGEWSAPVVVIGPSPESCNGLDDNCDGVVDNVGAGLGMHTTPEISSCGCAGGALAAAETCNSIDDDCDGRIDEQSVCGTPEPDTCSNSIRDPQEDGIDCGGPCSLTCGIIKGQPPSGSPLDPVLLIISGMVVLFVVGAIFFWRRRAARAAEEEEEEYEEEPL